MNELTSISVFVCSEPGEDFSDFNSNVEVEENRQDVHEGDIVPLRKTLLENDYGVYFVRWDDEVAEDGMSCREYLGRIIHTPTLNSDITIEFEMTKRVNRTDFTVYNTSFNIIRTFVATTAPPITTTSMETTADKNAMGTTTEETSGDEYTTATDTITTIQTNTITDQSVGVQASIIAVPTIIIVVGVSVIVLALVVVMTRRRTKQNDTERASSLNTSTTSSADDSFTSTAPPSPSAVAQSQ